MHWTTLRNIVFGLTLVSVSGGDAVLPPSGPQREDPESASNRSELVRAFGELPLRFEANTGQWDQVIRYEARARDANVSFTDAGATLRLFAGRAVVTLDLKVASGRSVQPTPGPALVTKSNYFVGKDPSKWRTNVPNFLSITYAGVRDGLDLVFRGDHGQLEYDFVVHPGSRVDEATLEVDGAADIASSHDGGLVIHTAAGDLLEPPPHIYQVDANGREEVLAGRYEVGDRRIAFTVPSYDPSRALVIDPAVVLSYSTFLGGSSDEYGYGIALDSSGAAYLTGTTSSTDFPTKGPFQATYGGGDDVFVSKLNASGSALVYSTYLGGSGMDQGKGIAVDSSGNAYVAGFTYSGDFPTKNAYQGGCAGSSPDGFVTKLDASGAALAYSTCLGGTGTENAYGIAVDSSGAAYVAGMTSSTDFPTKNALQGTYGGNIDGFITKLSASGSTLVYSTYLGGGLRDEVNGVAIDSSGNAYVTGRTESTNFPTTAPFQGSLAGGIDAFAAKLNASGAAVYSTYLGGASDDIGHGVACDASGNAYLVGETASSTFPTSSPFQSSVAGGKDVFVTKLNSAGSALTFSTYLGGASDDVGTAIAVDGSGYASITGYTQSTAFPTLSAFQSSLAGTMDVFVTKLATSGASLEFSTFLGASGSSDIGWGIAVGGNGNAYVTGVTQAFLFPIKGAIQGLQGPNDAFITEIGWPALAINPTFPTVPPKGSKSFTGTGGTGIYSFSLTVNNSGGSITSGGAYTAGGVGGVLDTVQLVDSENHTTTTVVTVGPLPSIIPASPTTPPKGGISFSASGGSNTGWTWSLASNNSGGTIVPSTGAYTAGSTANVVDTVKVVDSLGNTGTTAVTVGPSVVIAPATPSTPPLGTIAFTASGGSNFGWTWTVPTNKSGATIKSNGSYTAGATSNVADTVQVTDSLGNVASVNVSVGAGLAMNPASPTTTPKGTIAFTVTGGSGTGYVWSLTTNASGGSVDPSTGKYVAGSVGAVTDTVQVKDSLNNSASEDVAVGPSLSIAPSTATVKPAGSVSFFASGGSGNGYLWSLSKNASGATINANSGAYVAGNAGGVDAVQVVDSLGNQATASVTVDGPIADAGVGDAGETQADSGNDAGSGNSAPSSTGCGCAITGLSTSRNEVLFAMILAIGGIGMRRRARIRAR